MQQEVQYREEDGGYAVYHGQYRVFGTDEIALLINKNGYVVVNHGTLADVNARYVQLQRACMGSPDMADMADSLEVISGPFDVETVNRVIQRKESARSLYAKLEMNAAREAQDVLARVRQA